MSLRAIKPSPLTKRLKMFVYGPAGSGKTTACLQFPNAYIIDCERGTDNYDKIVNAAGSVVFQTTEMSDVIAEVKSLLTERHDYRTLIIDPITTVYNELLEKCEAKVGSEFGRHYGEANKIMKRLANLIMALDMNVVITAHAKAEYGQNLSKLGYTFDGWKQLDYWFDLVVELGKKGNKRFAKVVKTRIDTFPDSDTFEWSYAAIEKRYDPSILGRAASSIELASPAQIREVKELLQVARLPEGTIEKWFAKAGVDVWEDMPATVIGNCIAYVQARLEAVDKPDVQGHTEIAPQPNLADDNEFQLAIDGAFIEREFTPSQASTAQKSILGVYGVETIAQLSTEKRRQVLTGIKTGRADKFKAELATA